MRTECRDYVCKRSGRVPETRSQPRLEERTKCQNSRSCLCLVTQPILAYAGRLMPTRHSIHLSPPTSTATSTPSTVPLNHMSSCHSCSTSEQSPLRFVVALLLNPVCNSALTVHNNGVLMCTLYVTACVADSHQHASNARPHEAFELH